jgi:hypothetical protein
VKLRRKVRINAMSASLIRPILENGKVHGIVNLSFERTVGNGFT